MYRTKKELAAEYSISIRTVDRILADIIRPGIGSRYPKDAEITIGNRCRIESEAFCDAIKNRGLIEVGLK